MSHSLNSIMPSIHEPFRTVSHADKAALRDYFAGQALIGLLSHCAGEYLDHEHAKAAYGLADAMLKARGE